MRLGKALATGIAEEETPAEAVEVDERAAELTADDVAPEPVEVPAAR
ncbi:hypothetical protein ACTWJ8_11515 [Streptomyces sp. SDT5-1]